MNKSTEIEVIKEIELLSKLGVKKSGNPLALMLEFFVIIDVFGNPCYLCDKGKIMTSNRDDFVNYMVNSEIFKGVISANWREIYKDIASE